MKKIIVLSVFIMSAVIIFFACTKENNEISTQKSTDECQSCNAGIEIANKINNFKQRLEYARENIYKEYEFLFTILPQHESKPSNWLIASLKIFGEEHSSYPSSRWINHENRVSYGLAYCVKDEVLAPPVNP